MNIPRLWIGMTAGEARREGHRVADDVPDHALLGPREVDPNVRVGTDEGGRLRDVSFEVGFEWRWFKH